MVKTHLHGQIYPQNPTIWTPISAPLMIKNQSQALVPITLLQSTEPPLELTTADQEGTVWVISNPSLLLATIASQQS